MLPVFIRHYTGQCTEYIHAWHFVHMTVMTVFFLLLRSLSLSHYLSIFFCLFAFPAVYGTSGAHTHSLPHKLNALCVPKYRRTKKNNRIAVLALFQPVVSVFGISITALSSLFRHESNCHRAVTILPHWASVWWCNVCVLMPLMVLRVVVVVVCVFFMGWLCRHKTVHVKWIRWLSASGHADIDSATCWIFACLQLNCFLLLLCCSLFVCVLASLALATDDMGTQRATMQWWHRRRWCYMY